MRIQDAEGGEDIMRKIMRLCLSEYVTSLVD